MPDFADSRGLFTYRFPRDLATQRVPAYITFRPQEVVYGGITANTSYGSAVNGPTTVNNLPVNPNNIPNLDGLVDNVAREANRLTNINVGALFQGLARSVNGTFRIGNFEFSTGIRTAPDNIFARGSINLFLPEQLTANTSVGYKDESLGAAGFDAAQAIGRGTQSGSFEDILNQGQEGGLSRLVSAIASEGVSRSGTAQAIGATTVGVVRNPFSYQIFNGVEHRRFDYTFKCVPKNSQEAQQIQQIVDAFRYFSLPARRSGSEVHFYDIPYQWAIEYHHYQGGRLPHIQPHACFCSQINVSYGGDAGNHLHSDGYPIETTIALSFVEIEPEHRDRVIEDENRNRPDGNGN